MDLPAWQEISLVLGIVLGIGGIFWRLQGQINVLHRRLDDFRVEVARTYVTDRSMREIEERISAAIERLGDRLDRLFERAPRGR